MAKAWKPVLLLNNAMLFLNFERDMKGEGGAFFGDARDWSESGMAPAVARRTVLAGPSQPLGPAFENLGDADRDVTRRCVAARAREERA